MAETLVNTKSKTLALYPVLFALRQLAKERGFKNLVAANPEQHYVLELLSTIGTVKLSDEELRTLISDNATELNSFLKDNGFDIQLSENVPLDFGIVTILDLVGKWRVKADEATITHEGNTYQAAHVKHDAYQVLTNDDKKILRIHTQNGLCVFIEMTDQERSGIELSRYVFEQAQSLMYNEYICDTVIPFVSLDNQPDMDWLIGLSDPDANLVISQALQQNRLEINLDGIHAESATVIGVLRSGGIKNERPLVTIDKPFTMWIAYGEPDRKYVPLFAAYIAPDAWKEKK